MKIINYFDPKFKTLMRLYLLQLLIPVDGYFESALSLALVRALLNLEVLPLC